jgi:hypothetical protein
MLRNDRFPEGKTQVVKLPEDDVTSFATFAERLYVGDACETGAIFKDVHGKNVTENDDEFLGAIQDDVFDNKRKQRMVNGVEEKHVERRHPADKTTGTSVRRLPNGTTEAVTDVQANENSDGDEKSDAAEEDGEEQKDGERLWETGSLVDSNADYDHFDFSLQFSCYVLADKLQAFGFKRHILDEIHYFGEFCESSHLTVDQIRYVYANTSGKDDPLRKFCILLKCVQSPIHDVLADADFRQLMEDGGPLATGVIEICRKHAVKDGWKMLDDLNDLKVLPGSLRKTAVS